MPSSRVDYDAIAEGYDTQPHREKSADPALAAFLAGRDLSGAPVLLDIACGTGNQLIADRSLAPQAHMIGIDASLGMLRQARRKAPDIAWVRGDAAALPLAAACIDFVGCQYALHHFADKAAMLREAFRVLRPGGRLALYNLCPQAARDWLYYDYFPDALARDLADFWPPERIAAEMAAAGFVGVSIEQRHLNFDHDLRQLLAAVRRRDSSSQLIALSDAAYRAGLRRIARDLRASPDRPRADHLCFVTLCGDKPSSIL